jgi:hypothetical protein
MMNLFLLLVFVIGLVIFFDPEASFAKCFRGLFLMAASALIFILTGVFSLVHDLF